MLKVTKTLTAVCGENFSLHKIDSTSVPVNMFYRWHVPPILNYLLSMVKAVVASEFGLLLSYLY